MIKSSTGRGHGVLRIFGSRTETKTEGQLWAALFQKKRSATFILLGGLQMRPVKSPYSLAGNFQDFKFIILYPTITKAKNCND